MLKDEIKKILIEVLAFDEEHVEILDHLADRLVDVTLEHVSKFAIERFLLEKNTNKKNIKEAS